MRGRATPARLIVADDHALVREGTQAMLAREPDIEVIGEAENGREAVELCRKLYPDLVLMDVRMPEMDGLAATRAIKEECPETGVLVVTSHEDPDHLLDAIRAGAAGYVLKEATKHELLQAVRGVLSGESPLNQELSARLLRRLAQETDQQMDSVTPPPKGAQKPSPEALTEALSPRELEVLRLLATGKTNRQIARELLMSLSTVKRRVESIISKLEVSDRTQAAVRAVELGLHVEQG